MRSQENTAWLRQEVNAYYKEIMKRDGLTPSSIDYNNFTKDNVGRLAVKVVINGIMTTKSLYAKLGKPFTISTLRGRGGTALLRSLRLYTKLSQRASAALSRLDFEISRLDARASAVEMSDLAQISQEIDNIVVSYSAK